MANEKIEQLRAEILSACAAAADVAAVETVRVSALGKKGAITALMKDLSALPPEERKAFGQQVNTLRDEVTAALDARKNTLGAAELDAKLAQERMDVSLPIRPEARGSIHPISQTMDPPAAA